MGVGAREYMRERRLDYGGGRGGGGYDGGSDGDGRPDDGGGFPWKKARWWALACGAASAGLAAFGTFLRGPERASLEASPAADGAAHARALARATEELHSLGFVAVAFALPALVVGVLCARGGGFTLGWGAAFLGLAGAVGGGFLLWAAS